MSRNAAHAASHPCYAFPGYRCGCGEKSDDVKAHDRHVREKHKDDKTFCAKVLSWRAYNKLFGIKNPPRPKRRSFIEEID
jgi:hypothetical protein